MHDCSVAILCVTVPVDLLFPQKIINFLTKLLSIVAGAMACSRSHCPNFIVLILQCDNILFYVLSKVKDCGISDCEKLVVGGDEASQGGHNDNLNQTTI